MKRPRRAVLLAVLAAGALTACGASSPPAEELALEVIESLDVDESVKECMRDEVTGFTLTEEQAQGFVDLDDVADKAARGNEQAQNIMADFEASLAACN
ncbi:MAG: hypothetical protein QNJ12_10665 [Ilumatobacter sp.]|uniref:hypothetical protein n=1 Tax=Ilumatobacter sp. TaxID=1967498 RepID=UPI00261BB0F6|nr:hypothetical protein [Ilumatobacter sp.]MDJ0769250.1 hypothetical protein [Ilumatobacter sp.]